MKIFLLLFAYNNKIYNMFKHFEELSPSLNKGIQLYIDRLDMDSRNRELFYDIIKFSYNEGYIKGNEDYLNEVTEYNLKNHNEKEEN